MKSILRSKGVYHLQIVLLGAVAVTSVHFVKTTPAGTMSERIWIISFFLSAIFAIGLALFGSPQRRGRRSRKS